MSTAAKPNNNRMVLLLIGGIPVIMILASTWLWYYVMDGKLDLVEVLGTANQGTLVEPPRQVADVPILSPAGETGFPRLDKPIWTILLPAEGNCEAACEHMLYYTRQIHTAMGKYQPRIQRVLLRVEGYAELDETLLAEHPELKVLYTSASGFAGLFADAVPGMNPGYYVVDPAGWMMMAYDRDADGKDIMADLKFLLQNSDG